MEPRGLEPGSIPPGRRPAILTIALVALLALELALVWSHPRLPSNDGPDHQYSAWVAHRLRADPAGPLARWFELNPRLVYPNAGFSWFLQALADRVPMPVAEKLGASIFLLALPFAVALLARASGRGGQVPALAAVALSLNFPFFMGFFNFLWGVPLALLFWANLVAWLETRSHARLLLSNGLLAAVFCAHLVAFAVAVGGALVMIAAAVRRRGAWLALLGVVPVAALAPWFWPRTVGPGSHLVWTEGPLDRLLSTLTLGVASSSGGAERTGAAVVGLLLCVLAAAGLARGGPRAAPLRLLVAALFVLALAVPSAVGSGSFLGERVMLFFWLAAAAAIEPPAGRWRTLATALLGVGVLLHLGLLEARFRDFDRELADYLAVGERIPAGATLFAFNYTGPHQDFVSRPMATVDSYVHLARGTPDFRLYQAVPPDAPYFPIRFTAAGRARFPRRALHDRLPLHGVSAWADALLVWNAPARELRRIERQGVYRLAFAQGRLCLYERRTAPAAARGAEPTGLRE